MKPKLPSCMARNTNLEVEMNALKVSKVNAGRSWTLAQTHNKRLVARTNKAQGTL